MTWYIGMGRQQRRLSISIVGPTSRDCISCKSHWNTNTVCRWLVQVLVKLLFYFLLCTFRKPAAVKVMMVLVLLGAHVPCSMFFRSRRLWFLLIRSVILAPILRLATFLLFVKVMHVLLLTGKLLGHRRFEAIIVMRRWMKILRMNSQEVPCQPC